MNGKPATGARPAQSAPPRPHRPQYALPVTPDARTALQQSLDRRW